MRGYDNLYYFNPATISLDGAATLSLCVAHCPGEDGVCSNQADYATAECPGNPVCLNNGPYAAVDHTGLVKVDEFCPPEV